MEIVPIDAQQHIVLIPCVDDSPALHLAGTHADCRLPLPVYGVEPCGNLRPQCLEILDGTETVEDDLSECEHALTGLSDLGDVVEIALNDERSDHSAGKLNISTSMAMRMVPIGSKRMVAWKVDFDWVRSTGFQLAEHVVGNAAWAYVCAVCVEIGCLELMRLVCERGCRVSVWGRWFLRSMRELSPSLTRRVGPGESPS